MDNIDVDDLVEKLGSDDDGICKKAAFRLQALIGDPSFMDRFVEAGGLESLHNLTLHASGNTLAYALASFTNLLEIDEGWQYVNSELVERVSSHRSCAK